MRKKIFALTLFVVVILLASIPVLTVSAAACSGAPAQRLALGDLARPAQVYSTLWLAPNSTGILAVMYRSNGDTFTIVSGPTCANGPYNWYQVNFKGISGWVTEGTGSTYWVEKVAAPPTVTPPPVVTTPPPPTVSPAGCAGAPAPKLTIGGNARPAQVYSSLRAGLNSNMVVKVMYRANGDVFKVVDGPYCGTGPHNWWKVDYKGTVGWVTEGIGSTYWVEPAS